MSQSPSEAARQVLTIESRALAQLRDELPADFDRAVQVLLSVEGRVIVSGMGKSGHVANKIAATFASTGTPAQAVHPGEASHGDLGMITPKDAVILISNSGETRELSDMIAHCARWSIPLIAITKKADSSLGQAADHLLQLPGAPEACAIGMAPTTSTTMTMALGDALAVAMMEHRGFGKENFAAFHPGGSLGAQLLRVSAVMHRGDDLPVVTADTPMSETLLVMSQKGFGVAALVDDGQLIGIITDGDLRRNMEGLTGRTAGQVATRDPMVISPDKLLTEALGQLNANKHTVVMVVEADNRLVGLLHIHDILRTGAA
ncbi:MAG: KpsF/GutQ family sugar-phosphate isomerase [Pelagimonas sp.]|jgi:arabinose-5-phosphate isomerase|nr:KpsF/GutQ family sugar-phosphate isomerase [Pelagimonas sp.]